MFRERKSKYNAQITEVDGIKFRSKKEAKRYKELKMLRNAGQISWFLYEPTFHFPGGKHKPDFLIVNNDGTIRLEDVKGFITAEYKRIKKIVEAVYPVKIEVV